MATKVDGVIRISTKLDTAGTEKDLDKLEREIGKAADNVAKAGKKVTESFIGMTAGELEKSLKRATAELERTQKKTDELGAEMDGIAARYNDRLDIAAVAETNGGSDGAYDAIMAEQSAEMGEREARLEALIAKEREQKEVVAAITAELERQSQLQTETGIVTDRYVGKVRKAEKEVKDLGRESKKAGDKTKKAMSGGGKSVDNLGKSVQKGIKRLGKMALACLGVEAVFTAIRKAANAYMEDNEKLSQQISGIWNVAGQALGPIIEGFVNGLSVVITYVNDLVKALTGVDLIAKANAAALKKQATATKDAANAAQLAGFDEMDKLSDPSSGDENSMVFTPADTTAFEAGLDGMIARVKRKLQQMLPDLTPSLESWGMAFSSLKDPFESMVTTISGSAQRLWGETLSPFLSRLSEFFGNITNTFSTTFAPIFQEIMPVLLSEFAKDFEFNLRQIENLINDILEPALKQIETIWTDVCEGIKKTWDEKGADLLVSFQEFRKSLKDIWTNLYDSILQPIIDKIWGTIEKLWEEHLKPLWDSLCAFVGDFIQMCLDLWNNVLAPIVNWLIGYLKPIIMSVVNVIMNIVKTAVGFVIDFVKNIIDHLSGLCQFFSGLFTGDMKKALNGLIKIANSAIRQLFNLINGFVNISIDLVNALWNSIYQSVRTIVNNLGGLVSEIGKLLGKNWGFSMPDETPMIQHINLTAPQIPYLARGGIVNNPGRGVPVIAGEAGREAILPLDQNTGWMDELAAKINGGGDGTPIIVKVFLSGRQIHEEMVSFSNKRKFATNGVG